MQTTKPIRRYIMGSNHSFIGGLGENYAALGENWHINFQSPSLKKQKEKPTNGIKPLVDWTFLAQREGFEPSWDCSQTDFESAPLWPLRYRCVYFSQHQPSKSTPEKGENWWRELQKFFSLMIPPKPWKIKGFQKQFQSGHSFSIQPCYDYFDTAVAVTLCSRVYYTTLFTSSQVIFYRQVLGACRSTIQVGQ